MGSIAADFAQQPGDRRPENTLTARAPFAREHRAPCCWRLPSSVSEEPARDRCPGDERHTFRAPQTREHVRPRSDRRCCCNGSALKTTGMTRRAPGEILDAGNLTHPTWRILPSFCRARQLPPTRILQRHLRIDAVGTGTDRCAQAWRRFRLASHSLTQVSGGDRRAPTRRVPGLHQAALGRNNQAPPE